MENKNATLELTAEELLMLWQLLNANGIGAPLPKAHVGASLYAKVKAGAEAAGHVQA